MQQRETKAMSNDIRKLLELIEEIVNENKPWSEKRSEILAEASESEALALEEFSSWFEA